MTTFAEMVNADIDDTSMNTDEGGQEITYGGATINAEIVYGVNLVDMLGSGLQADAAWAEAVIIVKKSDVATFTPRTSVTIGSDTWQTKREVKADAYTRMIELENNMRPRIGR